MKANNRKLSPLQIIYILAIINSLVLIFFSGWITSSDSPSYIQAWDTLLSGAIDKWRTPTYPVFLGFIRSVVGTEHLFFIVMCLQHLLFLISIRYFYRLTDKIYHGHKTTFWITLIYALYPGITSWNNCILTESLAIILSVFIIYYAIEIWERGKVKNCILFTGCLLLLIFLRPSFLYMLPVCLVAWTIAIIKKKEKVKISLICILTTIIVCCCQFLYIKMFEQEYKVFTPSGISTLNQYYIARQNGLLNPEVIENPELKAYVEKSIAKHGVRFDAQHGELFIDAYHVIDTYGLKEVQEAVSASNHSNPIGWFKNIRYRSYEASTYPLLATYCSSPIITFFHVVTCNIGALYLFLIIYTCILFYWIYKHKSLPWTSCTLYMLGCSNLIVAIIGAQDAWNRLILPSIPIYLLMLGQLYNMIRVCKPQLHD